MVENREQTVGLRVTASERQKIRRAAARMNIRESELLRRAVFEYLEKLVEKKGQAA